MKRLLLISDPADSGAPAVPADPFPASTGADTPPPDPSTPAPAPPPAARIVADGKKTERELHLEREVKNRESRIAELEDENGQLKRVGLMNRTAPAGAAPAPAKAPWTFFDDEN